MRYDLSCRYDSRQCFYGKAQVEVSETSYGKELKLYSYGTLVASISIDTIENRVIYEYLGKYSQTTTRHQKEFFKQNGLSDKQIKELFKNGELEIKEQ